MKVLKMIAVVVIGAGALLCAGHAMAEDSSGCMGVTAYLRGGRTVEMTIGNEILIARATMTPSTCWIQVEVMHGPNNGRKYFVNLAQVSKITDPRP